MLQEVRKPWTIFVKLGLNTICTSVAEVCTRPKVNCISFLKIRQYKSYMHEYTSKTDLLVVVEGLHRHEMVKVECE